MPEPACPPDLSALMNDQVTWESFQGFDGHAEPKYAPAVKLRCFRESHGLTQSGIEVLRKADETISDPDWDLFFSGDDVRAEQFSLFDRFTPHGIGSTNLNGEISLQPSAINTVVGPNGDFENPWAIVVVL